MIRLSHAVFTRNDIGSRRFMEAENEAGLFEEGLDHSDMAESIELIEMDTAAWGRETV